VEKEERIPLPESYRLGLEGKGVELNHSGKFTNGFGKNNRPLFPSKGKGRGVETRNWISTFKVAGCIGCKDGGESVHKGRTGQPVVLVVGDEAVPTTVGVTKGSESTISSCLLAVRYWWLAMCISEGRGWTATLLTSTTW